MVRSVIHPQTRASHFAHMKNHRRAWVLMSGVVIVALFLLALGYLGSVTWLALGNAVFHTTYRLVIAYAIALTLGTAIALLVAWSSFADDLFPVFDVLQNVPSFALIPFFIYFLGYTDTMVILFAVSSIIWPILFAVLAAIKNAHKDMNDAATIFGARGLKRIPYYLTPLAFPAILTGSIVGIAIGWESVIGAEIIASTSGFGTFIKDASTTGITHAAIAGILVILIIVFVINRLVWAPLLAQSSKHYAE